MKILYFHILKEILVKIETLISSGFKRNKDQTWNQRSQTNNLNSKGFNDHCHV